MAPADTALTILKFIFINDTLCIVLWSFHGRPRRSTEQVVDPWLDLDRLRNVFIGHWVRQIELQIREINPASSAD